LNNSAAQDIPPFLDTQNCPGSAWIKVGPSLVRRYTGEFAVGKEKA
jgi:hypothetical protein